jgi:WS/DGAT/MGAT family acyltransferase
MRYERLSAQDTVFLRIEDGRQPQHVGSLSIYEGAAWRDRTGRIRIDDLRAFIESRIPRVPRMRQRLMFVPFGQGRPVWVDDDRFDIAYHIRLTALPRPGTDDQLLELMGRLQSQPLDRARPLWELWFVDGLEGDRVALVIKTHHALGDGIANVDLGMALLDMTAEVRPLPEPVPWTPEPAPTPAQLLAESLREQAMRPLGLARTGLDALRNPDRALRAVSNVGRTLWTMAAMPEKAAWNAPVTRHRRWRNAHVPMADAKRIKERAGCTLNDVVVAACTNALRRFMLEHDERVDGRVLKAMVPVSTRRGHEHGDTLGNRVSRFVVDLPVGEPDPVRQLDAVHRQIDELKTSGLADGAEAVIRLADGVTPIAAPLTRFVSRHIPMNLVITNIPGPPVPLWLYGAPLLAVYPYVEVVDNEGLTIAVLSYADRLEFGVTSDRDVVPDLGLLTEYIEKAFVELEHALGAAQRPAPRPPHVLSGAGRRSRAASRPAR